jgi:hypothetical protein
LDKIVENAMQIQWKVSFSHSHLNHILLVCAGRCYFVGSANLTERWLLVVDNADEEYISDNVKELLLGTWKLNTHGHILITTRREETKVEESIFVKRQSCISLTVSADIQKTPLG